MSISRSSRLLRQVLLADAAISGTSGVLMMLGAGLLERLLGVPAAVLDYVGFGLLPYAALVGWLATRQTLPQLAVWVVIGMNIAWAADCNLVLLTGWVEPTRLGHAFIIAQALVVGAVAELQYLGLRRSAATA